MINPSPCHQPTRHVLPEVFWVSSAAPHAPQRLEHPTARKRHRQTQPRPEATRSSSSVVGPHKRPRTPPPPLVPGSGQDGTGQACEASTRCSAEGEPPSHGLVGDLPAGEKTAVGRLPGGPPQPPGPRPQAQPPPRPAAASRAPGLRWHPEDQLSRAMVVARPGPLQALPLAALTPLRVGFALQVDLDFGNSLRNLTLSGRLCSYCSVFFRFSPFL